MAIRDAIRLYETHGFCKSEERELEEGTPEYIIKMTFKADYVIDTLIERSDV